jgi:hypothetical protein
MTSKVERVAGLAMKLGAKHLADYGSIKSKRHAQRRMKSLAT